MSLINSNRASILFEVKLRHFCYSGNEQQYAVKHYITFHTSPGCFQSHVLSIFLLVEVHHCKLYEANK
jgi:hypothetical protein